MAVQFVAASSERHTWDAVPASVPAGPYTASCWARVANNTEAESLFSLGDSTTNSNHYIILGTSALGEVSFTSRFGSSPVTIVTTTTISNNVWFQMVAVWTTNTDKSVFLNGGGKTNTTTGTGSYPGTGFALSGLGGLFRLASFIHGDGDLQDACIWNYAFSDAEVLALYESRKKGIDFQPRGLEWYHPCTETHDLWNWGLGSAADVNGTPTYVDGPGLVSVPPGGGEPVSPSTYDSSGLLGVGRDHLIGDA